MSTQSERWSKAVVFIHWASALLIIGLFAAGLSMVGLEATDPMRRNLGRMHTIAGNLLGLLTLARLVIRRRAPRPTPLDAPAIHRKGIAAVHVLLYVVSLAVVVTGLGTILRVRDSWHGYLLGELPKPPSFEAFASREVHEVLAFLLVSLVTAHLVGVVVQEVRKGGALRRMVPFLR